MSLPWPLLLVLVCERVGGTAHGDLLLGLTGAARMLPYVALSWATGTLADRFRRDRLRAGDAGRAARAACWSPRVAVAQDWLLAAVLAAAAAIALRHAGLPRPGRRDAGRSPARRGAGPPTCWSPSRSRRSWSVRRSAGCCCAARTRPWLPLLAVGAHRAGRGPAARRPAARGRRTSRPRSPASASGAARRAAASAAATRGGRRCRTHQRRATRRWCWPCSRWPRPPGAAERRATAWPTGVLGFGALAAPLLWRLGRDRARRAPASACCCSAARSSWCRSRPASAGRCPLLAGRARPRCTSRAPLTEAIQDAVPDDQRAGILGLTDSVMVGAALLASLVAPSLAAALGARRWSPLLAARAAASRRGAAADGGRRSADQLLLPVRLSGAAATARPRARSSSAAAPRG